MLQVLSICIFSIFESKILQMKKVFIAVLLFSTLTSFAQKASSKLTFAKGQKLEVVTNMNITSQSMMGPSSGTIVIADAYTVTDAASNSFSMSKAPKQIKLNFSVGSQEIKVDSDNPQDLNSMFGQPIKEIMNAKQEFTIDATGKILAVKKDEKKTKSNSEQSNMMGMMLPGLDLSASMPKEGNPSFFQILPTREIGIGESWKDSINIEGNKNVTVYKVKDITANEIILDFTSEGTTVSSQSAMGMDINVNAETKANGTILIDKATGVIKQKTSNNNTETRMNLGGREMTSTIKTTAVTNVK